MCAEEYLRSRLWPEYQDGAPLQQHVLSAQECWFESCVARKQACCVSSEDRAEHVQSELHVVMEPPLMTSMPGVGGN